MESGAVHTEHIAVCPADDTTLMRHLAGLLVLSVLTWPGLDAARAATLLLPAGADVIGEIGYVQARREDTLLDIARRYDIGYKAITLANPAIDPWLPGAGIWIRLPLKFVLPNAPREGVVLNLPELRLYYYPRAAPGREPVVITYPISVGRMDWSTPLGLTRIVAKVKNPAWRPPPSIRAEHAQNGDALPEVIPPGPDNPLGEYALRLAIPGYLIHGTNKPYSIGMRVTHGCVRLYPRDIEALFQEVPEDTPVRIVDQPHKAGWRDGVLYLESHPPLAGRPLRNLTAAVRAIVEATAAHPARINWDKVQRTTEVSDGIPTPVAR